MNAEIMFNTSFVSFAGIRLWFLEDRLWSLAINLSGSLAITLPRPFRYAWFSGQAFAISSGSAHDHLSIPYRAHTVKLTLITASTIAYMGKAGTPKLADIG